MFTLGLVILTLMFVMLLILVVRDCDDYVFIMRQYF